MLPLKTARRAYKHIGWVIYNIDVFLFIRYKLNQSNTSIVLLEYLTQPINDRI
nr:MAG TPA: hypothetical protein [Caudoviricetes sp.]